MNVASILGGGFALVRARPMEVMAWSLVHLLTTIAVLTGGLRPLTGPLILPAGNFGPSAFAYNLGLLLLMDLAFLLVLTMLLAAAQRAVLQPRRRGFAYLRIGMDEARLAALALLLVLLAAAITVIVSIGFGLVTALAATLAGPAVRAMLSLLEILTLLALLVWAHVRLSLAFPLTLLRGTIVVREAWRLTHGHFRPLFGAQAIILLFLLAVAIAIWFVTGGYPGFRPFQDSWALTVAGWVMRAAMTGFGVALYGGALATAARSLAADLDRLSETFA